MTTHPVTAVDSVAFVARGGAAKLANLRRRPAANVTFRAGWEWVAVEGAATIIGPDDPRSEVDADRLRGLLREVFTAAGGTHDDWDEYDRAMADERRATVFVELERITGNG